jgi:2-haloacid dehalogenase
MAIKSVGRRQVITAAATLAGATLLRSARAAASTTFRAIAFDGLAVFDPRPIAALANQLFPEKGPELTALWRVKQFDYQWLCALSGRYQDFQTLTDAALVFAAKSLKVELSRVARDRLNRAWLELQPWPDVAPALQSLKQAGLRLAPLANFTPVMLERAAANPALQGLFEDLISTGRGKTFKPDPRAYQLAVDAFGLKREEMLFVPSAGWDVAGARWFGYPTFWLNRAGAPPEELAVAAHGAGGGMSDLTAFLGQGLRNP